LQPMRLRQKSKRKVMTGVMEDWLDRRVSPFVF